MQNVSDIFGQVFRAIWANKLRSFLTMFGIAWGVGSMLLLISVGEGFRSGQRRSLATLGNDLIMMWSGTIPAVANQHTGMRPYNLTLSDAAAIRAQASEVRSATAFINRNDIKQQSFYQSAGGQAIGAEPNYSGIRFLPIKEGRFLNDADLRDRRRVIVLGEKSAKLLFPGRPVMGETVMLNGSRFQVIGLADKSGRGNNDNENQKIYIPLSTMLEMFPLKGENIPAEHRRRVEAVVDEPLGDVVDRDAGRLGDRRARRGCTRGRPARRARCRAPGSAAASRWAT